MHILFLTDNFPPEVNAPASRTFEHCREWVKAGEKVTVITCAPNFPKGKVFPGYKNKLWQEEEMEGIRVIRVWTYISANAGFLRRTTDYLSFMIMAIMAGLFIKRIDVIIGTSPQFFTVCGASVLSFLKRKPWVFELRDIWPESIKAVGAMKDSLVIRFLESIETRLYKSADRIVSVTHSFTTHLQNRGIDPSKVVVITNGADLENYQPVSKDQPLLKSLECTDCFVAGYIGTHGMAHGLDTLLAVAKQIQDSGNQLNFRLLFLGDGAEKNKLMQLANEWQLKNVIFLDTVPKSEVSRYWSILDVSIIHLRKQPLFQSVIPSKLFECMAMGIPVVHAVQGESADIVNKEGIGKVVESENVDQIAMSLIELKDNFTELNLYKNNCLAAAPRYDRHHLALQLLEAIRLS